MSLQTENKEREGVKRRRKRRTLFKKKMGDYWKQELASRNLCFQLIAKRAKEQRLPDGSLAKPDTVRWALRDVKGLTVNDLQRLRSRLVVEVQSTTRQLPRVAPTPPETFAPIPNMAAETARCPRWLPDLVPKDTLRLSSSPPKELMERSGVGAASGSSKVGRAPGRQRGNAKLPAFASDPVINAFNSTGVHAPQAVLLGKRRSIRRGPAPGPGAYHPKYEHVWHRDGTGASLKFRQHARPPHPDETLVGPGRYELGSTFDAVNQRNREDGQQPPPSPRAPKPVMEAAAS